MECDDIRSIIAGHVAVSDKLERFRNEIMNSLQIFTQNKFEAILTDDGADRLNVDLAGERVDVRIRDDVNVSDVYYSGERIGGVVAYAGDTPGVEIDYSVIIR
jgi:hypothetical protein